MFRGINFRFSKTAYKPGNDDKRVRKDINLVAVKFRAREAVEGAGFIVSFFLFFEGVLAWFWGILYLALSVCLKLRVAMMVSIYWMIRYLSSPGFWFYGE